jgi:hypothetical protein
MINFILLVQLLSSVNYINSGSYPNSSDYDARQLYQECKLEPLFSYDIFEMAIKGINTIDGIKNKNIITIIDFSKPSGKERFFVIDLEKHKVLYRSLVAHGKNSGGNTATSFSNTARSLKSSLGFYLTAETYGGKYGYSLKLDGLEPGINDNARKRGIVIHGADFVSYSVVHDCGMLGRSFGCPALPENKSREIIDKISRGSCLFIYAKDQKYLKSSIILNEEKRVPVAGIDTRSVNISMPRL